MGAGAVLPLQNPSVTLRETPPLERGGKRTTSSVLPLSGNPPFPKGEGLGRARTSSAWPDGQPPSPKGGRLGARGEAMASVFGQPSRLQLIAAGAFAVHKVVSQGWNLLAAPFRLLTDNAAVQGGDAFFITAGGFLRLHLHKLMRAQLAIGLAAALAHGLRLAGGGAPVWPRASVSTVSRLISSPQTEQQTTLS